MSNWKPMLATNANLDKMQFPIMSSKKLEGVRGEFTHNGLFTRPLKRFNNKLLALKFHKIIECCKSNHIVIEGEFYKHGIPFNEISSMCRKADDQRIENLEFHIFDMYSEIMSDARFSLRVDFIKMIKEQLGSDVVIVDQHLHKSKEEVIKFYEDCLEDGYEGWVGKDPDSAYKLGRSTVNEGYYIRLKPEDTFDGVVIDIVERLENLCPSEENELGLMSKKQDKDMKASTGLAAVAIVKSKAFNKPIRVSLSRGILDYTDTNKSPSRASLWANRGDYIGKNIRFVGFTIKGMDLPRSPRFDDWRTDLD